ncbi:hypothetical protein QNM97_17225 [Gordonia sp. L191]|uniref:hypothetical protein n=1 Tax=Gordonia sp. L191 TaxID=2982699 RepID=UPI0024BF48A2|nr:hypothetical protein [Gordonia sp. L191]WHU45751.1 hypothetical protein QNM97_17225 [Gordonia sp. L191]
MKISFRSLVAAATVSVALVAGSALGAPAASAAPTGEALAAKQALDAITPHPQDAASVIDGIGAANTLLKKLGITPFTPTIGACTDFTFPSALGGAVAGPYTPILGDLTVRGLGDINAVRKGEILYGFVPVGTFNDSGNKSGMQVAWFNVNTFQGGLGAPMGSLSDVIINAFAKHAGIPANSATLAPLKVALNALPSNGVRGGLVDTGSGTVLSAIYGTVNKGNATCYFFPSLGIATAR